MNDTSKALAAYRERLEAFVEKAAIDFEANNKDRDTGYWAAVIAGETDLLVRGGPQHYLIYLAELERKANR